MRRGSVQVRLKPDPTFTERSCRDSGCRADRTRPSRASSARSRRPTARVDRYGAFAKPMPCSPLIEPSSATTPLEQLALRLPARAPARPASSGSTMRLTWMLPSPAWPKRRRSRRSYVALQRVDHVEQLRDAAARHDDVVVDLQRGRSRAAPARVSRRDAPRASSRSASLARAATSMRAGRRGTPLDHAPLPPRRPPRMPSHFDDQQRAGARRREPLADVRADGLERVARRSARSPPARRGAESARSPRRPLPRMSGEATRAASRCAGGFGTRRSVIFGDDRQRAFRPDEQLRQVVADDVLHRLRAGADDLAGRQHRLEREHVALRRAVLERARPAGALGDVAADRRLLEAGRIRRIEQADALDRACRSPVMTFGSTTASRFGSSISRMRFSRSIDSTTPPRVGTAPPV